jgi:Gram-negative bacterial TonB protein C-terminal
MCSLALVLCFLVPKRMAAQNLVENLPVVRTFECPKYPEAARSLHITGTVVVLVTTDGHTVTDVKAISGPRILAEPAESNVRTWKFADHPPTTFKVTYLYVDEGNFKKDLVSRCAAKLKLPTDVTMSTKIPSR